LNGRSRCFWLQTGRAAHLFSCGEAGEAGEGGEGAFYVGTGNKDEQRMLRPKDRAKAC
jgi:hypothetical protein